MRAIGFMALCKFNQIIFLLYLQIHLFKNKLANIRINLILSENLNLMTLMSGKIYI